MHSTTFFDDVTTDTPENTAPAAVADFYALHDTDRQWLGTLQGAIDPDSLRRTATGRTLLDATHQTFAAAVADLIDASAEQDTGLRYLPTDGWPWPWRDSRHADWIYFCDGTRVWAATRAARFPASPTTLLPESPEVITRRIALIDHLNARASTATDDHPTEPGRPSRRRSRFDLVHEHVLRVTDRTGPLTDAEVAALARALTDPMVRDACLSLAAGEHAHAAETLWTQLVAGSPAPERAEPAALLAAFAYLHDDLDLATAAIAHALNAHPGHRLSTLINEAIATGMAPDHLLAMARDSHCLIDQL